MFNLVKNIFFNVFGYKNQFVGLVKIFGLQLKEKF